MPTLAYAASALAIVGALGLITGGIAEIFSITPMLQRGMNLGVAAQGLIYLILAFFVHRRSLVAAGLAVALVALDMIALLFLPTGTAGISSVGGLILRAILLVYLIRGVGALRALRSSSA